MGPETGKTDIMRIGSTLCDIKEFGPSFGDW